MYTNVELWTKLTSEEDTVIERVLKGDFHFSSAYPSRGLSFADNNIFMSCGNVESWDCVWMLPSCGGLEQREVAW
jgi:hypothetical protein